MDVPTELGPKVHVFVFFCDGCGKVVRAKKWRGRHRIAIDKPPAGWVETIGRDQRLAWCSKPCEKQAYTLTEAEIKTMEEAQRKRIMSALKKCARKVWGLKDWEKAPWEEDKS